MGHQRRVKVELNEKDVENHITLRGITNPKGRGPTLVFCGEPRRDLRASRPGEKLPRVTASGFQSEASCMHVIKFKRVAMQL